jgi:hypothetical protein
LLRQPSNHLKQFQAIHGIWMLSFGAMTIFNTVILPHLVQFHLRACNWCIFSSGLYHGTKQVRGTHLYHRRHLRAWKVLCALSCQWWHYCRSRTCSYLEKVKKTEISAIFGWNIEIWWKTDEIRWKLYVMKRSEPKYVSKILDMLRWF